MANKSVSDKRVVKTAPVEVSVISTLPPGLDEGQYRTYLDDDNGADDPVFLDAPPAEYGPGEGNLLDTPTEISIKSQTLRFAPDGSLVVDVVVSVSEVKGATNYELRHVLAAE